MEKGRYSRRKAFAALGTSKGNKSANLKDALKSLSSYSEITIIEKSSVYESAPLGGVAKNQFYNMAILIETSFTPFELLKTFIKIEDKMGRVRDAKWADRLIDLDVILFEGEIIESERLTIPHPEYLKRSFVIQPLLEIDEKIKDPKSGTYVSEYLKSDSGLNKLGRLKSIL